MKAYYMIGKRLSNSLSITVPIVSAIGTDMTTTVVASDGGDSGDIQNKATTITPGSAELGTATENDVIWYASDADAGDRLLVGLNAITTDYDQLRPLHNPAGEKTGESTLPENSYKLDRYRGSTAWDGDIAETSLDSSDKKLANAQLVESSTPDYLKNRCHRVYDVPSASKLNGMCSQMISGDETYYLRGYLANNRQQWFTLEYVEG